MPTGRELTPAQHNWMALLFLGFGMFMLAMAFGLIQTRPGSIHAPLWVLASAGMVFISGAGLIFLVGREGVDTLRNLVVWLFVLCLALPFNWIAFGEGERHFSGSVSGMGLTVAGSSGGGGGRWAFGFFAVLLDWILLWSLFRLFRRKPPARGGNH